MTATLPAYTPKPGSLAAFVQELGKEDPKMPMATMRERITKKFDREFSDNTIHALRAQFGVRERAKAGDATAEAPKRKRGGQKGVKRGKYKLKKKVKPAAAGNGHSKPAAPAEDAAHEFRKLVARIGTDAAERILAAAKQV